MFKNRVYFAKYKFSEIQGRKRCVFYIKAVKYSAFLYYRHIGKFIIHLPNRRFSALMLKCFLYFFVILIAYKFYYYNFICSYLLFVFSFCTNSPFVLIYLFLCCIIFIYNILIFVKGSQSLQFFSYI